MVRLAFKTAYLGENFFGSQQQIGKRTVAGEVINALSELNLFDDGEDGCVRFSGRTDKGVSARAQITALNTEYPKRCIQAINQKLPADISFTGWCEVADDFNPRYAAKSRTYRYVIPCTKCTKQSDSYSIDKMRECAELFIGVHDFTAFSRNSERTPIREIYSSTVQIDDSGNIIYEICGNSFLWNMVRCIVYALEEVGCGRLGSRDILSALDSPEKFGRHFPAANPEGLILWDIDTDLKFNPMPIYKKQLDYSDSLIRKYTQMKSTAELWKE